MLHAVDCADREQGAPELDLDSSTAGSTGAGSPEMDRHSSTAGSAGAGSRQQFRRLRRNRGGGARGKGKKGRRRREMDAKEEARDGGRTETGKEAETGENGDREGGGDGGERRQGRRLRRRGNGDREGGRDGGERRQGRRRRRGRTETGKEADGGRTETGKEAETAGEWRQGMEAGDDGRREGGRWEMTVRKMGAGRRGEASREVSREARAGDREEGRRGQGDGAAAQALGHEWIRRLGQRMRQCDNIYLYICYGSGRVRTGRDIANPNRPEILNGSIFSDPTRSRVTFSSPPPDSDVPVRRDSNIRGTVCGNDENKYCGRRRES
ncbi:hypothetical protein ACLOJK_001569 [Asimina triloba]